MVSLSAIYGGCIVLGALLWKVPVFLAIGYLVISFVLVIRWNSRIYTLQFVTSLLLGSLAEAVGTTIGAWRYSGSLLFPLWLPIAWGLAGVLSRRIVDDLEARRKAVREDVLPTISQCRLTPRCSGQYPSIRAGYCR